MYDARGLSVFLSLEVGPSVLKMFVSRFGVCVFGFGKQNKTKTLQLSSLLTDILPKFFPEASLSAGWGVHMLGVAWLVMGGFVRAGSSARMLSARKRAWVCEG